MNVNKRTRKTLCYQKNMMKAFLRISEENLCLKKALVLKQISRKVLDSLARNKWQPILVRYTSTEPHIEKINPTADGKEIGFFNKLNNKWWHDDEMKPLHLFNQIRVPFIRDGLINTGIVKSENVDTYQPLKELDILDVGCGGGILTEALARLGCTVTGLDASTELIEVAKSHALLDSSLKNLNYTVKPIEEYCESYEGKYDAVIASEVIEHVSEKDKFVKACVKCLKPGGSIFFTTFNKTLASNIIGIYLVEYVVGLAPKGTHTWDKFIPPHNLERLLEDNNCRTRLIHGTFFNPLCAKWSFISDTSVHYALHAVKNKK